MDFKQNNSYFLEINNIDNSNIKKINPRTQFKHFIVFCGKGLNLGLIKSLNLLAKLTSKNSLFIGITDRGDLDNFEIDDSIFIIPLNILERNIPKGYTTENYLISELKSISCFIKNNFDQEVLFFSRLRKDIFLDINVFINYLSCVPILKKKYRYICSEESSNLMRINCISDIFFTLDIKEFLRINIPYRYKINNPILNWFFYRQPYEIFKNDHQLEQWLWKNIFLNNNIEFSLFKGIDSYLNFLKTNFLILSPSNIGYRFTRGSKFNIFNQTRFVPKGKYLFRNTNPLTNFVSHNLIFGKLNKDEDLIRFIKRYKIIFFIKKIYIFILKVPFYVIKYLLRKIQNEKNQF